MKYIKKEIKILKKTIKSLKRKGVKEQYKKGFIEYLILENKMRIRHYQNVIALFEMSRDKNLEENKKD